jgi:hypothetical protein
MLYIFGDSLSTACDLSEEQGWVCKLAKKLNTDYINLAQVAADNFYIYSSYLSVKNKINHDDIVIVGWTHPSRKSFVYDHENTNHIAALDNGLQYQVGNQLLFRSFNPTGDSQHKWKTLAPKSTGKDFFDVWFRDYYSDFEQQCHLQSYYDSVKLTCAGKYIPFFFSKLSIKDLDVTGVATALEFIIDNKVFINENNMHFNDHGHSLWAELIYKTI